MTTPQWPRNIHPIEDQQIRMSNRVVDDVQSETLSEFEWQEVLSDAEYRVLREASTEPAGTSDLLHVDDAGVCEFTGWETKLFPTEQRYTSGIGWPTFFDPIADEVVKTRRKTGILAFE